MRDADTSDAEEIFGEPMDNRENDSQIRKVIIGAALSAITSFFLWVTASLLTHQREIDKMSVTLLGHEKIINGIDSNIQGISRDLNILIGKLSEKDRSGK